MHVCNFRVVQQNRIDRLKKKNMAKWVQLRVQMEESEFIIYWLQFFIFKMSHNKNEEMKVCF